MKKISVRTFGESVSNGTVTFSKQFNFAINQNLLVLPVEKNSLIKKIEIKYLNSSANPFVNQFKFFEIRFRGLNRDGVLLTQLAGNILNPVSGPFNGSLTKNTDLDFVLSSRKNFIEFKKGIDLGGISLASESYEFYKPTIDMIFIRNFVITYE